MAADIVRTLHPNKNYEAEFSLPDAIILNARQKCISVCRFKNIFHQIKRSEQSGAPYLRPVNAVLTEANKINYFCDSRLKE